MLGDNDIMRFEEALHFMRSGKIAFLCDSQGKKKHYCICKYPKINNQDEFFELLEVNNYMQDCAYLSDYEINLNGVEILTDMWGMEP